MKVFGVAGWSGSGKTTLMVRLVPALVRLGLRVATVKHTHHDPALADSDSLALMAAGARQVLVASPCRFTLMQAQAAALAGLAAELQDVDLVLVEGFKFADHEKLEIWDPALGRPQLAEGQATIVAVASAAPCATHGRPWFQRDDVAAIASFVKSRIGC